MIKEERIYQNLSAISFTNIRIEDNFWIPPNKDA